ncbi:MHYT domain-containing protein, partial [Nocardia fluminea]
LVGGSLTEIEKEEVLLRMGLISWRLPQPCPSEPARLVPQYAPNPQHEYRTEELSYDGVGAWPRRVVD